MPHDEYIALVDCHSNFQMEVWAFRLEELLMTLCIVLYDIGLDGNIIGDYQLVGPNILPQTKRKNVSLYYHTYPSSSTLNSFKSLIKSNLNAIRKACCELI